MSRMTSLILGLRNQAGGPRWLGMAMIALIALTLGWAGVHAWPVLKTSRLPARPAEGERTDEQRRSEFALALEKQQAQVNGRSPFFIPPRPRPPHREPVVDNTPRETPKPTRYGGPAIVAMVNGAVMFADGQRVKLGESGRGVKVVALSAPWSARLEWQGVEFDVELFQRESSVVRPANHSSGDATLLTPPGAAKPAGSPGNEARRPPANGPADQPATPPSGEPTPDPEPTPEPEPEPQQAPGAPPDPAAAPPEPPASPEPQPQPPAPEFS